jgi:nucleotide-binding universal stress UspA family protein
LNQFRLGADTASINYERRIAIMYRSILIPLDGSEIAETILPEIEHFAPDYSTRIVVVRVCQAQAMTERYASEVQSRVVQEVEAYLEDMKARLNAKGFTVELHICSGAAAWEILDLSERTDVDLIAMSTHGRSGIGRWLLGSVAEKVLRHSRKPVLLLPAKS